MGQHIALLIAREARHRLGGAHGTGDRLVDDIGHGQRGTKRDLAGEFVDHLEAGVRLHRLVVEIERIHVLEFHAAGLPYPGAGRARCLVSRSEEHTSDLPSILRTSYHVFYLQTQKQNSTTVISYTHKTYEPE